ncbi:MFS transporter [Pseudomonas sediminis]|uniref:MFS transporter n=1 Tax=Pseudomonas sediminis TaxID=1691904 RepID=A0A2G5FLL8_9PSED|nr:MFS transporter [Pseudomonas sediminis]PIA68864.1 MFS transporter [Pseudomonas sediminis]
MNRGLFFGATGFGLIAICYGFARFAFGLFLPQIEADLVLPDAVGGLIAGGSFLGYCLAIILAAQLTERIGARAVAVCAALVAALGMLGIALAPTAAWLAAAVLLAGMSTGLASPPMAAAVAAVIEPRRQDATNTLINAGTSAGVILCGPVALLLGAEWRLAYTVFACSAFALALFACICVPDTARSQGPVTKAGPLFSHTLKRLVVASLLMGAASTALWSFGSQIVAQRLSWGSAGSGLLWVVIGAAGIAGAGAGSLIARLGVDWANRLCLGALAAAITLVGMGSAPALTLLGGALFGAAYITLSGIYLVWGVAALPERPATGLTVAFLSIAIGQTLGAPVFGLLMSRLGMDNIVCLFSLLALAAGVMRSTVAETVPSSPIGCAEKGPH